METEKHALNEVSLVYKRAHITSLPMVQNSNDAADLLRGCYSEGTLDLKEIFFAMYLNNANRVLAMSKMSEGGVFGTVLDLGHLFAQGVLLNATAVILCHNHPSGNVLHSPKDLEITLKCQEAGRVLDIQVLDHIILTSESYMSFADEGLIILK